MAGVLANESTVYDQYGNVDYSIDFNGQKADYVYDYDRSLDGTGLGRLVEIQYFAEGATTPAITMAYTYDALGRQDTVTETAGSTVRVTDTDYNIDGQIITITSPEGVIHYEYDPVTSQQMAMWTSASRVEYGYDALGLTVSVSEVVRNGETLTDPQITSYTYTAVGQVDTVTVTSGSDVLRQTTNEYDSQRHWLTGIVNEDGAGSLLSSFEYTRRADGQITYVSERVQQPDGSIITGTTSYTYDTLNRLILEEYDGAEVGSDYTIDYGLDLVGNRYAKTVTNEGETPVTTTSEYDDRDRLTVETTGSQVVSYTYDANGSLTMKVGGGEIASYDWDAMGRMASATVTTDGVTTTNGYRYTADGIRAAVTDGAVTTRYVVDGMSPSGYAQVVEKWSSGESGSPVLLESTVYGLGLDPISQYTQATGAGLFLPDGHSGPRQVIDGSGAVLLVQRWDAYGNVMAKAGTFATDVTYRGERANGIGGGIYLRARMYDPASGRFRSMDPFGGNYGNLTEAMRYGYAGGNPVGGMDPSGMLIAATVGLLGGIALGTKLRTGDASAKLSVLGYTLKLGISKFTAYAALPALGYYGGLFFETRVWSLFTIGRFDGANVLFVTTNGESIYAAAKGPAIKAKLNEINSSGKKIREWRVTAHGGSSAMQLNSTGIPLKYGLGNKIFTYEPDGEYIMASGGQIILGSTQGEAVVDITSDLNNALAPDGVIVANGCITEEFARGASNALQGRMAWGTDRLSLRIADDTVLGKWKAFKNGQALSE
ncbi:MAG: hypothetical protein LC104_19095 [Bacteroidales bacterium]|nr:hypothetical protein [Bacteroidales bacterium]